MEAYPPKLRFQAESGNEKTIKLCNAHFHARGLRLGEVAKEYLLQPCWFSAMQGAQVSRKKPQAQKTRKNIVIAATKLFARQGYYRTNISDICRAMNLTSGAVFHHFPSKEALLCEVITRLERGVQIYSNFLRQSGKRSTGIVIEIIGIMCDHFKQLPEATICLASLATGFAGNTHHVEKRLKNIYEGFVNDLARVFESHSKVTDPNAAAISFVGAVQGIAIHMAF